MDKSEKSMSKKSIKLDSYAWIAENGSIDYGFYFGDTDEPIQFHTTLKELVRDTLEAYKIVGTNSVAPYHLEDMQRLGMSLKAACFLIDHEIKRLEGTEAND
jgi:hypothetical protein